MCQQIIDGAHTAHVAAATIESTAHVAAATVVSADSTHPPLAVVHGIPLRPTTAAVANTIAAAAVVANSAAATAVLLVEAAWYGEGWRVNVPDVTREGWRSIASPGLAHEALPVQLLAASPVAEVFCLNKCKSCPRTCNPESGCD